jgi:circadian clock protein KaiB
MAAKISLEVYVAGRTPAAARALRNLYDICGSVFSEHDYEIAVIDILESPNKAERANILATPTVLRVSPGPERRVIGDLTDRDDVISALDLTRN